MQRPSGRANQKETKVVELWRTAMGMMANDTGRPRLGGLLRLFSGLVLSEFTERF